MTLQAAILSSGIGAINAIVKFSYPGKELEINYLMISVTLS